MEIQKSETSDLSFFAPFVKVDPDQRLVWGYASTPTKDLQDERVSLAAVKNALPDYMEWANIREMHQLSAVGKTQQASVDDKGLFIRGKIVDDKAWNKVKEGVYQGFSIGGDIIKKVGNEIQEVRLTEISIVDRPANPECKLDGWKVSKALTNPPFELVKFEDGKYEAPPLSLVKTEIDSDMIFDREEIGLMSRIITKLTLPPRQLTAKSSHMAEKFGDGFSSPAGPASHSGEPEIGGHPADERNINEHAASAPDKGSGGQQSMPAGTAARPSGESKPSNNHPYSSQTVVPNEHVTDYVLIWPEFDDPDEAGMEGESAELCRAAWLNRAACMNRADKDGTELCNTVLTLFAGGDAIKSLTNSHLAKAADWLAELAETPDSKYSKSQVVLMTKALNAELSKREFSQDERDRLSNTGAALPDGSYPIANESDLHNAIQAFGRAKDKAKVKRHIISRARALGATHVLPADWPGSTKKETKADDGEEGDGKDLEKNGDTFDEAADESAINAKADYGDTLQKFMGMFGASNLSAMAGIYDQIKMLTESIRMEGASEYGDEHDMAMGDKLQTMLEMMGAVIADHANHEVGEEEDKTAKVVGALEAHGITEETVKMAATIFQKGRHSNAHKAALHKAAHHVGKCMEHCAKAAHHHKMAMGMCAKAQKATGGMILVKAEDLRHHLSMLGQHVEGAGEQAELASSHLGKAMGDSATAPPTKEENEDGPTMNTGGKEGEGADEGEDGIWEGDPQVKRKMQSELTEGEVEDYPADSPYERDHSPGTASPTGIKTAKSAKPRLYTQAEVDAMTENAALRAKVENMEKTLANTPAGPARARLFAVEKRNAMSTDSDDPANERLRTLYSGVEVDNNDPDSLTKAGAKLLTNMLSNPRTFGKSLSDPNFKGGVGTR